MSLHAELIAAHRARRADWSAKAVPDEGINLRRIGRRTRVHIMPWVPPVDVWAIKAHIEPPPLPVVTSPPLAAVVPEKPKPTILPAPVRSNFLRLKRLVANHFGLSVVRLCGPSRIKPIVRARQVAMYLAHVVLGKSFPETGRQFGQRDHTTAINAVRRIEFLMATDERYVASVEFLTRELRG